MVNLTPNAVSMLYHNQAPDGFEPWLQIIDTKKIKPASGTGGDRYRIVLSDGTSYLSGMLATQLAPMMENESLKTNYVLQLKDYLGNEVQGRRIIIVLKVGDIVPHFDCIGSPQNIDGSRGPSVPAAPAASVPPAAVLGARPTPPTQSSYQQPQAPANQYQQPPAAPSSYTPPAKPAPSAYNRGPVVRQAPNIRLSDIQSLNPYAGGRWTIKARVTTRSPIKNWTNSRGSGKLFSVDLLDAKKGEIRATFFNDGVDKFYEMLRPGGVFYFAGGKVKMANRRFSSVDNDYEVTFDPHSEISPAPEDGQISQMQYAFKKIAEIENVPADSNVDIIGIVRDVSQVNELMSKAGKQLFKRDISLVDDSNAEIKCTMWNEQAQQDCSNWLNQVLAIKGCRVSEYNGRSISTVGSSSLTVNPTIPEAGHLVTWFSNGGNATQTKSLSSGGGGFGGGSLGSFSERAVISDIKGKQLGFGQKPDYITVKGTVNFIKHDTGVYYQACPKCQKKVVADVAQNYTCEKCQTSYPNCENSYILSVVMLDHTGSTWTTCFNDQGKVVMGGRTADEIGELRDTNPALFESIFKEALFKQYVCRLRVKAENVQEELRVKAGVVNLEPVNFVQESKDLLQAIAQYN
ncbi:Replication protein A DNA-binding subunit [Phytophthora idaei]|nr:Replication protein A DNA-binding subunit [Phytophthora idaei]